MNQLSYIRKNVMHKFVLFIFLKYFPISRFKCISQWNPKVGWKDFESTYFFLLPVVKIHNSFTIILNDFSYVLEYGISINAFYRDTMTLFHQLNFPLSIFYWILSQMLNALMYYLGGSGNQNNKLFTIIIKLLLCTFGKFMPLFPIRVYC